LPLLRCATYLAEIARQDDALAQIKRARDLEPLSLIGNAVVGRVLYYARQYDQAIPELEKSLELDPNFAQSHLYLGWVYEQQKRYEDAIPALQKAFTLSEGESETAGALGHAYAVSGQRPEAEKAILALKERSTRQYIAPFDIAVIYGALAP
jgi:tetratricopeptide (TPR) repeat protein